jgi:hypothetical protein
VRVYTIAVLYTSPLHQIATIRPHPDRPHLMFPVDDPHHQVTCQNLVSKSFEMRHIRIRLQIATSSAQTPENTQIVLVSVKLKMRIIPRSQFSCQLLMPMKTCHVTAAFSKAIHRKLCFVTVTNEILGLTSGPGTPIPV